MFDNRAVRVRRIRQRRVRKRVRGTAARPRLCVFRSNKHIYTQVIADDDGKTLVAISTLTPELRERLKKTGNAAAAHEVGKLVGQACLEKGISSVVFDRNGWLYHGRVKALADGAREAGLKF